MCLDQTEFCREYYGKPFEYRLHLMSRLCGKAEVKVFGFHGIRHLSASILFKLGYEVAVIQTILRHKSPSTTERYLRSTIFTWELALRRTTVPSAMSVNFNYGFKFNEPSVHIAQVIIHSGYASRQSIHPIAQSYARLSQIIDFIP